MFQDSRARHFLIHPDEFCMVSEKHFYSGCSKTTRCKAPETGDPPEGWGVRFLCGQIPKSEAYIEVRRNDKE